MAHQSGGSYNTPLVTLPVAPVQQHGGEYGGAQGFGHTSSNADAISGVSGISGGPSYAGGPVKTQIPIGNYEQHGGSSNANANANAAAQSTGHANQGSGNYGSNNQGGSFGSGVGGGDSQGGLVIIDSTKSQDYLNNVGNIFGASNLNTNAGSYNQGEVHPTPLNFGSGGKSPFDELSHLRNKKKQGFDIIGKLHQRNYLGFCNNLKEAEKIRHVFFEKRFKI